MTCVCHYEIKPPMDKKFTEKNKCICTKGKLGNGMPFHLPMKKSISSIACDFNDCMKQTKTRTY